MTDTQTVKQLQVDKDSSQEEAGRKRNARMLTCTAWWKQKHVFAMYLYLNFMKISKISFFLKAEGSISENNGYKETANDVERACTFN